MNRYLVHGRIRVWNKEVDYTGIVISNKDTDDILVEGEILDLEKFEKKQHNFTVGGGKKIETLLLFRHPYIHISASQNIFAEIRTLYPVPGYKSLGTRSNFYLKANSPTVIWFSFDNSGNTSKTDIIVQGIYKAENATYTEISPTIYTENSLDADLNEFGFIRR